MASFMRVPFMLVFHQSNCVSAIKRMLFYYHHVSIFVFFHVFVGSFLLLPCMLNVACGNKDVIQYTRIYEKKTDRNFGKTGHFYIVFQINKARDFTFSGISDQIRP